MTPRIVRHLALIIGTLVSVPLKGQCPDGTQPPCRPVVRVDNRKWIVLPFHNVSSAPELEWIRVASVGLLSANLARWEEIHVVDDERVPDLVRATPETRGVDRLSFEGARAVAKRAGAGNFVIGDVLKVGSNAYVTAKVYRTQDGQRVRTIERQLAQPDSIMVFFSLLTQAVLGMESPQPAAIAGIGTSSLDAYQRYLRGVVALNRFEFTTARRNFTDALRADSMFALAHYKLSMAAAIDGRNVAEWRTHADAAARLSDSLPSRHRSLIAANAMMAHRSFPAACERYAALVRVDSSDVESLFGLADCLYRDRVVEPANRDSTLWRFRTNWNAALRLFTRVLQLDPSYHLAFQPIVSMLTADRREGCRREPADECPETLQFLADVRREADSLLTRPIRADSLFRAFGLLGIRARAQRGNLEHALRIGRDWQAAAAYEARPHIAVAAFYLRRGELDSAEIQLSRVPRSAARPEALAVLLARHEIAVKRGRGDLAGRFLDSALALATDRAEREEVAASAALGGRLAVHDSIVDATFPVSKRSLMRQVPRLILGVARDSDVIAAEREFFGVRPPDGFRAALSLPRPPDQVTMAILLGLKVQHDWSVIPWPSTRLAPFFGMARRDYSQLQMSAKVLGTEDLRRGGSDAVVVGTLHTDLLLLLTDSAAALQRVRFVVDSVLPTVAFSESVGGSMLLWPRLMLLRADLAAAFGSRDEALVWYARFLELWGSADSEFQPVVARVRRSYAALR